jgi:hypothetical protein
MQNQLRALVTNRWTDNAAGCHIKIANQTLRAMPNVLKLAFLNLSGASWRISVLALEGLNTRHFIKSNQFNSF